MVRFKNRYVTVQINPTSKTDKPMNLRPSALHYAVQQKIEDMFGDFGIAAVKAGFTAKYCNTHTRIALIKTRHGPHRFLLDSIPCITDVAGRSVSIKIMYVGATLKHCFDFIKKYQRNELEKMWSSLRTEMERKDMETAFMTMTPEMRNYR